VDLRETLAAVLAADDGIAWAYLFGSAARGGAFRDVDVAIMPRPDAYGGLVDLGALVARLEEACRGKVDLVDLRSATLPFSGPMLRERVVLLDRAPDDRHFWEAETTLRWLDFRSTWEAFQRTREEAIRRRLERRT
jgi:predicted nucleotidyltransferase